MTKKKILVVDDEPDIATTIKYALEQEEYDVAVSRNGEEGLKEAREGNPDLVILDLKLPKLPGEEICREIRRDKKTADIPIIMLTAKDLEADRIIGRVIGADYYMTKPFDLNALLKKINTIFDKPKFCNSKICPEGSTRKHNSALEKQRLPD